MKLFWMTIVCLSLLLGSCSRDSALKDSEKIVLATEVREMLNNYYLDIRKSGLLAEFNYLDSSADFCWIPPGYTRPISFDSVSKILRQNAPMYRSINNSFDTLTIIPLSREIAVYSGRLRSTMTNTSNASTTLSLVETGTVIKRKTGWKLLSGQTSLLGQ